MQSPGRHLPHPRGSAVSLFKRHLNPLLLPQTHLSNLSQSQSRQPNSSHPQCPAQTTPQRGASWARSAHLNSTFKPPGCHEEHPAAVARCLTGRKALNKRKEGNEAGVLPRELTEVRWSCGLALPLTHTALRKGDGLCRALGGLSPSPEHWEAELLNLELQGILLIFQRKVT